MDHHSLSFGLRRNDVFFTIRPERLSIYYFSLLTFLQCCGILSVLSKMRENGILPQYGVPFYHIFIFLSMEDSTFFRGFSPVFSLLTSIPPVSDDLRDRGYFYRSEARNIRNVRRGGASPLPLRGPSPGDSQPMHRPPCVKGTRSGAKAPLCKGSCRLRRLRGLKRPLRHSLRSCHLSCCGARHLRRHPKGFLICRPLPLAQLAVSAPGGARFAPPKGEAKGPLV